MSTKNKGQWAPGVSGNPQGTSSARREALKVLQESAMAESDACIKRLIALRDGDDGKLAFLATCELLSRAAGKPASGLNEVQAEDLASRVELNKAKVREMEMIAEMEAMREEIAELRKLRAVK